MVSDKPKLFKDYYNRDSIGKMAAVFRQIYPTFNTRRFISILTTPEFRNAELKNRTRLLAQALKAELPDKYPRAIDILIQAAPHLGEFENWALTSYVELYGLENVRESSRAMHALTQHGTAEFAIRPFINRYPDEMLPVLHRWIVDPNEHVRRLVAEGTRPRGVWCEHITEFRKDPSRVIEILDKLRVDPSPYVRKAVANNLNDISRDNPSVALTVAARWMQDKNPHTNWIVKHACRSLIKSGRREVFPLFGFTPNPKLSIRNLRSNRARLSIGESVVITGLVVSKSAKKQKLVIDYRVTYVSKLGKNTRKVFKHAEKSLAPSESSSLTIMHSFRNHSTRSHYAGKHMIDILVNGIEFGSITVSLK